jgi:FkbM family methyltransferase
MSSRDRLETVLSTFGLYRPVRDGYQRLANRDEWQRRSETRALLRPLVPAGERVFDVGANRGEMASLFLALGARVVAVEPLPELATLIARRYRSRRLTVEACAVGREIGQATLHIGSYDEHSTLSDEWHDIVPDRWAGELTVPVRTLDDLIGEHGEPSFIKIDVEGYERQVLGGLSAPVRALSFEYRAGMLDEVGACIDALRSLGDYRFSLNPPVWESAEAVVERVAATPDGTSGDIYARLT